MKKVVLFLIVLTTSIYAYNWPLSPTNQQHKVIGAVNELREGGKLHYGVDILPFDVDNSSQITLSNRFVYAIQGQNARLIRGSAFGKADNYMGVANNNVGWEMIKISNFRYVHISVDNFFYRNLWTTTNAITIVKGQNIGHILTVSEKMQKNL